MRRRPGWRGGRWSALVPEATLALGRQLQAVNLGVQAFGDELAAQGAPVTALAWSPPPAEAMPALRDLVLNPAVSSARARANDLALDRFEQGEAELVGVRPAREVIPWLREGRRLLHAGPPLEWEAMCGPMRGGVVGAIVLEGWAGDPDQAEALAARGGVELAPCHAHAAVGPMAGVTSPSMPVWLVENTAAADGRGAAAHSTLNEGLGAVLRYGANGPEVLERLRWMAEVLGPALDAALRLRGPLSLPSLIGQALHMGDECHNRNRALTSLLYRALAPALVEAAPSQAAAVLRFIDRNDHFGLNVAMAAAKALLDPLQGIPHSSLVTAMARNGIEVGISLAGLPGRWWKAPAPQVDGLFFSGYGPGDANPDLGDSAITETAGLGGFALAAAPAIVQFVGGTPEQALAISQEMYEACWGESSRFTIPALGFRGTATGVDALRVVHSGVTPVINTGIAHRQAGVGQIGAGLVRVPMECFASALQALAASETRAS
jgi:hypothetical protein